MFKRAFCGINTLHACVFIIYIWQLGSFRASTLWFIDLTVASCHIQYTFLSSLHFFFTRKWTKHENTRSAIFLGYENSCRRLWGAQSINTGGASLKTSMRLIGILSFLFSQHPMPYCPELHFSEFSSAVADMKNSVQVKGTSFVSDSTQDLQPNGHYASQAMLFSLTVSICSGWVKAGSSTSRMQG